VAESLHSPSTTTQLSDNGSECEAKLKSHFIGRVSCHSSGEAPCFILHTVSIALASLVLHQSTCYLSRIDQPADLDTSLLAQPMVMTKHAIHKYIVSTTLQLLSQNPSAVLHKTSITSNQKNKEGRG